jgi:hypothetical protein
MFGMSNPLAAMSAGAQRNLQAKLIFDGRYPLAMEYAKRLHKRGISSVDTRGDLVGLWYRDSDALRLQPEQVLLGCTTWSDYQVLRILIDDARLGRETRILSQGNYGRPTHLRQDSGVAGRFPETLSRENRVHLLTWLAFADPVTH